MCMYGEDEDYHRLCFRGEMGLHQNWGLLHIAFQLIYLFGKPTINSFLYKKLLKMNGSIEN